MSESCTKYIETSVKIYFQPGHYCCDACPMMQTYSRKQCNRTGEYLFDTHVTVGVYCPLEISNDPLNIIEEGNHDN